MKSSELRIQNSELNVEVISKPVVIRPCQASGQWPPRRRESRAAILLLRVDPRVKPEDDN